MARKILYCVLALWALALTVCCVRKSSEHDSGNPNSILYQLTYSDCLKMIKNDGSRLLYSADLKNGNDEPVALDSILRSKILVVRYSELDCNVCVDTVITYAARLSSEIGIDRIAVFAKVNSKRDFHLLSRAKRNSLNIYQANCRITGIDDGGSPYMFVLNEDHTISHLFIPHKEFPNMIAWHLETVKNYLAHHQ